MHDDKLGEVLCETAEQIFFQEFEDKSDAAIPERVFWATVQVRSPERFEVVVAANDNQLRENISMMFSDKEITDETVKDMVAELANTIAGSLSSHLSDEVTLDLSPPKKGLGKAPEASKYHGFSSDELTLFVAVRELSEAAE